MTKVLLVDDEPTLLNALCYNLQREGYDVLTAKDGVEALTRARSEKPDLVVLDIMLPDLSGLDVCRILRSETSVPILMLTARSDEMDRVLGLELGADEYVVKPVGVRELLARVRALLRRTQMPPVIQVSPNPEEDIQVGPLQLSVIRREAFWEGTLLNLRPKEFDLLHFMLRHEGQVLSRDTLLSGVWGYDHIGDPRTVDVHIRWLRQKIEANPGMPVYLQTIRGAGYRLSLVNAVSARE